MSDAAGNEVKRLMSDNEAENVTKSFTPSESGTYTFKAAFFEEVYGIEPILERVNK